MDGLFPFLEDEGNFSKFIKHKATDVVPPELEYFFSIKNKLSDEHIALAHAKYSYEIERYSTYLDSKNPDHYKRSGTLLHALCTNPIVAKIECEYNSEEVASGFTRFNNFDAEHIVKYLKFHESYCNQFVAFDISFRACCSYERAVKPITFEFIQNVCHYLKHNDLPADAYFMLFKCLMA